MKVAFIGHSKFGDKVDRDLLEQKVQNTIEKLITEDGADEFLFGEMTGFDSMCYIIVSQLKEKYPQIKRVFISQYGEPNKQIQNSLNEYFEVCKYPIPASTMRKKPQIERNQIMIDESDLLIAYYDKDYKPEFEYFEEIIFTQTDNNTPPLSKTKIALTYAFKKDKKFINLFSGENSNV
ncbi:MAG: SLOG family protein [Clostridia bacterium]|nr:SLOG family protein [Clostridia bacterium]